MHDAGRPLDSIVFAFMTVFTLAKQMRHLEGQRTLRPEEVHQLVLFELLHPELERAARASISLPRAPGFVEQFEPFAAMFEAADAATRKGGMSIPDIMGGTPSGMTWCSFPVTPASMAWWCVGETADDLTVILRAAAAPRPERAIQLEVMLELRAALAAVIEPERGLDFARVDAAFAEAAEFIFEEIQTIIAEAKLLAATLAGVALH